MLRMHLPDGRETSLEWICRSRMLLLLAAAFSQACSSRRGMLTAGLLALLGAAPRAAGAQPMGEVRFHETYAWELPRVRMNIREGELSRH